MNVRKHKCNHPTCTTSPVFGVAGTRKAEFCAPHAKEGMVPVSGKKCSGADCTKQLVYGLMGTTKAIVCVQHREGGLVNVVSKRCGSLDCTKMASFGRMPSSTASGTPRRETGMVNLLGRHAATPRLRAHGDVRDFRYQEGRVLPSTLETRNGERPLQVVQPSRMHHEGELRQ